MMMSNIYLERRHRQQVKTVFFFYACNAEFWEVTDVSYYHSYFLLAICIQVFITSSFNDPRLWRIVLKY